MIKNNKTRYLLSFLLLLTLLFLSVLWGRYPKPGFSSLHILLNDRLAETLLWNVRIPRIITALLLGASLAASGTVLQTVLGNPLVEPGLLGVTQGAAFGAGLAILLSGKNYWNIYFSAIFFGLLGITFTWILAKRIKYGGGILRLILSGIIISALFSSGLGNLKYVADPRSVLPEITFWLMGSLSSAGWDTLKVTFPLVTLPLLILFSVRWKINLLSLDDRTVFALGSNPSRQRMFLIFLSVIAVASITAVVGIISWVGLLIPQISRKITGADTAKSLPFSALTGAVFVLFCDNISRGAFSGEIPLGLITSLTGAVFFAVLMSSGVKDHLKW